MIQASSGIENIVTSLAFVALVCVIILIRLIFRKAKEHFENKQFFPIADNEKPGWRSPLSYQQLEGQSDKQRLVSFTMNHIERVYSKEILKNYGTYGEKLAQVRRIITVTTLPSFNLQYGEKLELSKKEVVELSVQVVHLVDL